MSVISITHKDELPQNKVFSSVQNDWKEAETAQSYHTGQGWVGYESPGNYN